MFINYIITAWRSLLKNRLVSIINIGGLTIGLASAVLAIIYANHELTYENSHTKADRISKLYLKGNFESIQWVPTVFGPEGPALKNMFPEIEAYSRQQQLGSTPVRVGENLFYEDYISAADSNYFKLFTINFIEGAPSLNINTAVISEKIAHRYFGKENPIGKSMILIINEKKSDFIVTGVYQDFPSNTHLTNEIIIPFENIKKLDYVNPDEYSNASFDIYLLLKNGDDYEELNKKIESTFKIPVEITNIREFLIPLKEIHMRGTYANNKGKLVIFVIGGFFVLIITCMNYINLTNILFSTRTKEIGIRKVNGARYKNIVFQFLTDTVLSTLIAFNLAIIIIKLTLPWFNSLMDTNISIEPNRLNLLLMLGILIATIVMSGIYPALRYSFVKPVNLMKPVANTFTIGGKGRSRRILTSVQFFLSIVFIQFMMALNVHGNFLSDESFKKYNSDHVLCISGQSWGDLKKVKEELLKNPSIEAVSWGSALPEMGGSLTTGWKDEDNEELGSIYSMETDYLNVFDISMLQGHFFSNDLPSELDNGVVINQLAATVLDYKNPIGEKVLVGEKYYTIIGVVDSYRAVPPIFAPYPMFILASKNSSNYLTIRINPLNSDGVKQYITNTLNSINPDIPVELKYHQDLIYNNKEAKSFISASQLMNLFFILTIITSMVGLFGLSLFIAQRHRKEVSIRKVFGAPVSNIMLKLSKGLIIQVILSIILATPVSMMIVTGYLSVFPADFHLGLSFYLMGGVFALILVLITVGWQTWLAANQNPAEALRFE